MNNTKKIALYIILAAFLGGLVGSLVSSGRVEALNFRFRDIFKNLISLPELPGQSTSTLAPSPTVPYAPTVDYEQKIIQTVEAADPAVVSIVISKNVPILENCAYDPFSDVPDEFKQFFGEAPQFTRPCPSGKTELQEVGGGSGFILEPDGVIVTNKHVVSDASASYTVFTNDGKKYEAKVLARDPLVDFAVIKIDAHNLPVLAIGDSDSLKLGQTAIAIGNALGEFRNTVSVGVISGLKRNVTASGGGSSETIEGVIQTDAAINPGNSGGPLLNLRGEVVGINTAVATGAQNIGFAIPINQVKRAIKSIKQSGKISVPYLGVSYVMISDELSSKEKLASNVGALVRAKGKSDSAVIAGSPAERAGLKAGDIILEVNGEKIDADHTLGTLIQKYSVGDEVNLKVLRNGQTLNLKITLAERKF